MVSPWPSFETWLVPVFFLGLGGLFLLLAFFLLEEYRKLFFANPRAAMTFEVLAQLFQLGTPGYIGAIGLAAGGFFFVIGATMSVLFIVVPLLEILRQVFHAIALTFQI
jgi:hypothetical protein